MEFLSLIIIFVTAAILLWRPQRERLAFGLLLVSAALMVFLFALATRTSLLPGLNY